MNQCDGCQAGIPVDENNNHRMGQGAYSDLQGCQKNRYMSDRSTEENIRLNFLVPAAQTWTEKHYYVECPYCAYPEDMGVETYWKQGEEWICDRCNKAYLLPKMPRD